MGQQGVEFTTCMANNPCDQRCTDLGCDGMHCHYCGCTMKPDPEGVGPARQYWICQNERCGKTEAVTAGLREAPLNCSCSH